jgi:hypothetical protein
MAELHVRELAMIRNIQACVGFTPVISSCACPKTFNFTILTKKQFSFAYLLHTFISVTSNDKFVLILMVNNHSDGLVDVLLKG